MDANVMKEQLDKRIENTKEELNKIDEKIVNLNNKKTALKSKLTNLENERMVYEMKSLSAVLGENGLKVSDIFAAVKSGKLDDLKKISGENTNE